MFIVLEMNCGRRAIEPELEQGQVRIVEWVWKLYGKGKLIEAADPRLCGDFDEQQMECSYGLRFSTFDMGSC